MGDPKSFEDHFNEQTKGSEGNAIGEHLWQGMNEAFGFADDEHRQTQQSNNTSMKLHERYKGQPGKHGFDERGEAYYQVDHPSGWHVRTHDGPYLEVGHKATPDEAHEVIDVGHNGESGHDEHTLHPAMTNGSPEGNHSMLKRELDSFVGEHGDEYAESISSGGDKRVQRWHQRWKNQKGLKGQALRKQAHDSGDGETIYHCPFCGSGQVIARSDKTIECEFCHTCFTVQVQPQFAAFPQTIDGMPVAVPGMPGQVGMDGDPNAGMDPSMDPNAGGMAAGGMPEEGEEEPPEEEEEEGGGGNPFTSKRIAAPYYDGYVTSSGYELPVEDYMAHLAISAAADRQQVIAKVRARRAT